MFRSSSDGANGRAGKRAQSDSPSYLRGGPPCALHQQSKGGRAASARRGAPNCLRPAEQVMSRSNADTNGTSSPASTAMRSTWDAFSAGAADRAQDLRTGLPLASFASAGRTIDQEIGSIGPAIGQARSVGVPRRGDRATRTWSSSSRSLPTIGRKRRRSAMPTFSSCRGSHTCGGAATRWCWNRRAPAHCSGFAIRRLRLPLPCCRHAQQIKQLRRRNGFPGDRASRPAGGLPNPVQGRCRRRQRAATGRGRRRPRSLGLSRSSVPRAQHGRPARQPAGRTLSVRGRHACAAGGAAPLARKEDRFAQALGRALRQALAGRKAAARTSFDSQLR